MNKICIIALLIGMISMSSLAGPKEDSYIIVSTTTTNGLTVAMWKSKIHQKNAKYVRWNNDKTKFIVKFTGNTLPISFVGKTNISTRMTHAQITSMLRTNTDWFLPEE